MDWPDPAATERYLLLRSRISRPCGTPLGQVSGTVRAAAAQTPGRRAVPYYGSRTLAGRPLSSAWPGPPRRQRTSGRNRSAGYTAGCRGALWPAKSGYSLATSRFPGRTIWLHTAPPGGVAQYRGWRGGHGVLVLVLSRVPLTFLGRPEVRWGLRRPDRWWSPSRWPVSLTWPLAGRAWPGW